MVVMLEVEGEGEEKRVRGDTAVGAGRNLRLEVL